MNSVYFEKKNGENLLLNESIISEYGNNYIRFSNGIQMCWDHCSYKNGDEVPYPKEFSDHNVHVVMTRDLDNVDPNSFTIYYHWNTVKSFIFKCNNTNREFVYISYIAIGKWK